MAKQIPPSRRELFRLITTNYIIGVYIQSITTSDGNVKIILTRLISQAINASPLLPCFSKIGSTSVGNSIELKLSGTELLFLFETNSRPSFNKILKNLSHLLTTFEIKSKETYNTNKKKYKIELLTCNISNLFQQNLTFSILLSKMYYINTFIKISDH